jgi:hypothetical protein
MGLLDGFHLFRVLLAYRMIPPTTATIPMIAATQMMDESTDIRTRLRFPPKKASLVGGSGVLVRVLVGVLVGGTGVLVGGRGVLVGVGGSSVEVDVLTGVGMSATIP